MSELYQAPEFTSAAQLRAHYAATAARVKYPKFKAVPSYLVREPVIIEVAPVILPPIEAVVAAPIEVAAPKPVPARVRVTVTLEQLRNIVLESCGVTQAELLGGCRMVRISRARAIFAYLAKAHTKNSYHRIGGFIGVDHSSVVNCVYRVRDNMEIYDHAIVTAERKLGLNEADRDSDNLGCRDTVSKLTDKWKATSMKVSLQLGLSV